MDTRQNKTIAEAAQACLSSFEECMRVLVHLGPKERALLQNQLSRFSLWASNIGVFASGRASLDYRLREVDDIHRLVRGLLEALSSNLNKSVLVVECWVSLPAESEYREKDAEDLAHSYMQNVQSFAEDISLLHQLSNTIRKAGRESQNSKAAKRFEIKDKDDNNIEAALRIVFFQNLTDQFPDSEEVIRQRLASTMVLRRKRILYRRSRQATNPSRLPVGTSEPEYRSPSPQPVGISLPIPTGNMQQKSEYDVPLVSKADQSVVQSQINSTTTLDLHKLRQPSTPSIVSRTKSIALNKHDDLVFPSPPRASILNRLRQLKERRKIEHLDRLAKLPNYSLYIEHHGLPALGSEMLNQLRSQIKDSERQLHAAIDADRRACNNTETEVVCPYCFEVLSSTKMKDERNWKEHLKNDLDPYICLFQECEIGEELYSHSQTWLGHMKQHALRWTCQAKTHSTLTFETRNQYESHMKEQHRNAFTDAQLSSISDRNARMLGPLFQSCPLCGLSQDDNIKGRLEDHIVGHLRFLALKSLPLIEEEEEDSNSSRSAGSDDSVKPLDRSTLRDLLDHGHELDFKPEEDLQPVLPLSEVFSELDNYDSTYAFASWGGLQAYIESFYDSDPLRTAIPKEQPIFKHPLYPMDQSTAFSSSNNLADNDTTSIFSETGLDSELQPFESRLANLEYRSRQGRVLSMALKHALLGQGSYIECDECGESLSAERDFLKHIQSHGDPSWFIDPAEFPGTLNSDIRQAQWGMIFTMLPQYEGHENDPVLQTFLHRAFHGESDVPSSTTNNGLIRAITRGTVSLPPDHKLFVPIGVIRSALSNDGITAVLEADEVEESYIPTLCSYIRRHAARIFAALVAINQTRTIRLFQREKYDDLDLPENQGDYPFRFAPVDDFHAVLWRFRAPIFLDQKFEYEVNPSCPLPFVEWDKKVKKGKNSTTGRIYEARIHPDHMLVAPRLPGNPCDVVVKVLLETTSETTFSAECDVLYSQRNIEHPNLLKTIAAYMRGTTRAFIFPRAEGSLEEFWRQNDDPKSNYSQISICWAFQQMRDLADALSHLHQDDFHRISHGDLKPANILRFKIPSESSRGLMHFRDPGVLVIGAPGFENKPSGVSFRYSTANVVDRSRGFEEEIEGATGIILSQRLRDLLGYDTLSFGCICLEFLIWILYGYKGVKDFRKETPEFFSNTFRMEHNVLMKIIEMKQDTRCARNTPLGEFLAFLEQHFSATNVATPSQHYQNISSRRFFEWLYLVCDVADNAEAGYLGVYNDFFAEMKNAAVVIRKSDAKKAYYFAEKDLLEGLSEEFPSSELGLQPQDGKRQWLFRLPIRSESPPLVDSPFVSDSEDSKSSSGVGEKRPRIIGETVRFLIGDNTPIDGTRHSETGSL